MSRTRHLPRAAWLCVPLAILALLAGCSGSGGGGSDSGGASAAEPAPAVGAGEGDSTAQGADTSAAQRSAVEKSATGSGTAADPLPAGTRRVRTAEATIRVGDVRAAAARVRVAAAALGGLVGSEQISYGDGPSTMIVRVPEPKLDQAMDSFAATGTETSRSMTSDDVTATIADLNSRVATQQASVKRVRALLNRAQKLGDVVLLEGELTRRQADLEAAQARYRALDDQATLATATLTLMPKGTTAKPPADDDGFLAGFTAGWKAVKASTTVLLTVLGALAPLAIVLAVLALPLLAWRRRRPVPPAPPEPQPDAAPAPDPDPAPVP